jgi:hypothetical protein
MGELRGMGVRDKYIFIFWLLSSLPKVNFKLKIETEKLSKQLWTSTQNRE